MPRIPLRIPPEDWPAAPIQLELWLVEAGDVVDAGDVVAELSIPGLVGSLVAPAAGRVVDLQAPSERRWQAGDIIGWIETAEDESS
uniref:Lipoyl-binding domain-containing protein n=1 Tax=Schlesneria paludicola TaxID=360056 RepID=A0A7C4LLT3_9PLAN